MPKRPPELERLSALLPLVGQPLTVEPMPAGSSGDSCRIKTERGQFVAKFFFDDAPVLLDAARQFELLETLAPLGIAPAPVGFDSAANVLVVEFLSDARAISVGELRAPERIVQVAAALRGLHDVDFELPRYRPADCAGDYLSTIGGRAALAARDRARFDELIDISSVVDEGRACLCHNDLTHPNLLFGERVRFIDFDYATRAPASLDLAGLAVLNAFSTREAFALQAAYYGDEARCRPTEFARVVRLVRLLAHFWSLASVRASAAAVAQYRIRDD